MPRGKIWLQEEIKSLLNGVQKSGNLDILMSSRHAKVVVWGPIAQHLVRDGYQRTWKQCRAKWKVLRRAFHLEHEYKLLYGTHSSKRTPRYRIMLRMWQQAGRPVFREQHEKSTSLQQHSQTEEELIKAFILPHSGQGPGVGYRTVLNGCSGAVSQGDNPGPCGPPFSTFWLCIHIQQREGQGKPLFITVRSTSRQNQQVEDEEIGPFVIPHSSHSPRTGYRNVLNGCSASEQSPQQMLNRSHASSHPDLGPYLPFFPENGVLPPAVNCVTQFQQAAYRKHFSYTWKPEVTVEDLYIRPVPQPPNRISRTNWQLLEEKYQRILNLKKQPQFPLWSPEEEGLREQDSRVKEERLWTQTSRRSQAPGPAQPSGRLPSASSSNTLWSQTPLPTRDSERPPATSSSQQTEMIQLLGAIQKQQQEIINRLDYLNHNLVQAALLNERQTAASTSQGAESKSPLFYIPSSLPTGHLSQVVNPTTYIPAPQSLTSQSPSVLTTRPTPSSTYSFVTRPSERKRHNP